MSKENVGVRKDSDDGEDDAYDGGDAARNARKMPGACWESADVAEVIDGIKGRNSASSRDVARNAPRMPGACWESADVAEVIGGIKGKNSASDGESGVSSIP